MNERVRILSEEASKLTPEERVELMERINITLWDHQEKVDEAWEAEARRRFEAYERGQLKSYSWDEIRSRAGVRKHSSF